MGVRDRSAFVAMVIGTLCDGTTKWAIEKDVALSLIGFWGRPLLPSGKFIRTGRNPEASVSQLGGANADLSGRGGYAPR